MPLQPRRPSCRFGYSPPRPHSDDTLDMHSIFDLFRVSIGPSSSRTTGPMLAGKRFIDELRQSGHLDASTQISVKVYGLLAATAKEHLTREAIVVGLSGLDPLTVDTATMPALVARAFAQNELTIHHSDRNCAPQRVAFALECLDKYLPLHRNGITFEALSDKKTPYANTYYSVGYGNILDEAQLRTQKPLDDPDFPFASAADLVEACNKSGLSISAMTLRHERALAQSKTHSPEARMAQVRAVMQESIQRGLNIEGVLPGPFEVPRRAALLYRKLQITEKTNNNPALFMDWVNAFAMAVSEENAAAGRIVTAPTNGASGVIPAVLSYFDKYIHPASPEIVLRFLMTAGMIGLLYKTKSSILGSEMGCQGEIGVACSMAAGGLAEILGGSPLRVCNAAEIGMEHNLGLTCDPVNGQVQIPCIERNAIAAVKAINAANMAMQRPGDQYVSLDKVIEAMYETGKDMNIKYRETCRGGLSIKVFRRKL